MSRLKNNDSDAAVNVYYADIRDCLARRDALERTLPPGRAGRMRAYLRDDDRLRCLAGWLLMARVLGNGGVLDETELVTGPHGKPYLEGGPLFSLSHSGWYVLLAVGDADISPEIGPEVGADIEVWRDDDYTALGAVAFHPSERDRNMDARRFFELWAAKESYLKWLGTGLSREPSSFAVTLRGRTGRIEERPDLRLRLYDAVPGYSIAVCSAAPPPARCVMTRLGE